MRREFTRIKSCTNKESRHSGQLTYFGLNTEIDHNLFKEIDMNKMSKKEYEIMIANTIAEVMGPNVFVKDMDIKTAKAILKRLQPYLYFREELKDKGFYKSWKNTRSIGKAGIPVRWTSRKNGKKKH